MFEFQKWRGDPDGFRATVREIKTMHGLCALEVIQKNVE